eukprot:CAMPEP_0181362718 /NCGR_PEP_ID=MMETSP1106-20121128/8219_1 /TAXON_ID=81844 /ORGANISM="Mantoniella antarctica, Strain SL-175" /LENGTH=418 /DNA_ID=CAMNT_0023476817 /DNA_START=34 /DNA_END=1290 /DNA_ORIENTATION=-
MASPLAVAYVLSGVKAEIAKMLWWAAEAVYIGDPGGLPLARILISKGADVNQPKDRSRDDDDNYGAVDVEFEKEIGIYFFKTLLSVATEAAAKHGGTGHGFYGSDQNDGMKLARLLVENGAKLNVSIHKSGREHALLELAVMLAIDYIEGGLELVELMVEKGADVDLGHMTDYHATTSLLCMAAKAMKRDRSLPVGNTSCGSPGGRRVARFLLSKGATLLDTEKDEWQKVVDTEGASQYFQKPRVITTGEEDEIVLFEAETKVYLFEEGEWTIHAFGQLKLLRDKNTGNIRVLMRSNDSLVVCLNILIRSSTELIKSEMKVMFTAMDFSTLSDKWKTFPEMRKICCKFGSSGQATSFTEEFEKAMEAMKSFEAEYLYAGELDAKKENAKRQKLAKSDSPEDENEEGLEPCADDRAGSS